MRQGRASKRSRNASQAKKQSKEDGDDEAARLNPPEDLCYWSTLRVHSTLHGCVDGDLDECTTKYSDEQSAVEACEKEKECNGITDGASEGKEWTLRTALDHTRAFDVQPKRKLACGSWELKSNGAEGGRGCEGHHGE